MRLKAVSGILLTLLLIGMLILAFNIQLVKASGTIYIRADGSIDPVTAPISTVDNVTYAFTDNIYDEIVVERDNIVVDGAGYTLQGNGSGRGIGLSFRSNVTIKNMEIRAFWRGIYLYEASNNTISGNNITNNDFGIWLKGSSNNTLRNNGAANNKYNFGVYDMYYPLSDYIQDIDDSNTVDGKPVYYWVNKRDMAVPLDAGYVTLINCTRITVKNLNLTNNGQGVLLVSTTNSTMTKNSITANYDGIYLYRSSNHNSITQNNITNNDSGIRLYVESNYNTISGNSINNGGIDLYLSAGNIISGNNITANNRYTIELGDSGGNIIYHNNFVNNVVPQVIIWYSEPSEPDIQVCARARNSPLSIMLIKLFGLLCLFLWLSSLQRCCYTTFYSPEEDARAMDRNTEIEEKVILCLVENNGKRSSLRKSV